LAHLPSIQWVRAKRSRTDYTSS